MRQVLSQDWTHLLYRRGGNYYIEVRYDHGEHHATNRAWARKKVKEVLGPEFEILEYLGPVYLRLERSRRSYSVVRIG